MRWFYGALALALACGGEEAPSEAEAPAEQAHEASAEASAHEAHGNPGAEFQPLSGARVSFVNLQDGATVRGPLVDGKVNVHVVMGVEGAEIRPAGTVEPNTGHHHIIVDGEPVPQGTTVPADATHIHFGGGQTEADVPLAPGRHTLLLQLADHAHRSYGPELTARVTITVQAADEAQGEGAGAQGEGADEAQGEGAEAQGEGADEAQDEGADEAQGEGADEAVAE